MKARVTAVLVGASCAALAVVAVRLGPRGRAVESSVPAPSPPPSKVPALPAGPEDAATPAQSVVLHLPLSEKGFGARDEVLVCEKIEDDLDEEITRAGVGEMDGNEIGGGECTLFMYGPDADKLFAVIAPRARSSRLGKGGWATKSYGSDEDANVREVRVDL
jgi:hypothetical protein